MNQRTAAPNRPQIATSQTLELPPGQHQGDGQAVQKDACAGASEGPSGGAPSRPAGSTSPRPAAASSYPVVLPFQSGTRRMDPPTTTAVCGGLLRTMPARGARQAAATKCSRCCDSRPLLGTTCSASPWLMLGSIDDSDLEAWRCRYSE